jgi:hypothetical protein
LAWFSRRKSRSPDFSAQIEVARFQRQADRGVVAEIVGAQQVEIIVADVDRQIAPPVILDPLQLDEAPGLEALDPVGTAAERRLQRGLFEIAGFPVMLRQDRHLPDEQRQLAVAGVGEAEFDAALIELFHRRHAAVNETVLRRALRRERLERPDHVVGGDRHAIVPACDIAQREDGPGAVAGPLDALGDEPVE